MKCKPGIYKVKVGYRHLVIAEHPEGDLYCFSIPIFMKNHRDHPPFVRVAYPEQTVPNLNDEGVEL